MKNYSFNTDMLSLFEARHPLIVSRVAAVPPDQRRITAITVRERLDGWYGLMGRVKIVEQEAALYQRLTDTVKVCATMRTLPYDTAAIARFKEL